MFKLVGLPEHTVFGVAVAEVVIPALGLTTVILAEAAPEQPVKASEPESA